MIRRIGLFLAALVMAIGGMVVTSPAAGAAVGCYGDYCSGKDPQSTQCANDARTTVYKDIPGGQLQVRWSPACKTNWARLVVYPTGFSCTSTGGTMVAKQDTGYKQSTWVGLATCYTSTTVTYWTPMIYSPVRLVRAELGSSWVTGWS